MDHRLFEATPGINLIILPDAPNYQVVAISNDFVDASGLVRNDIKSKNYLDIINGTNSDFSTPSFSDLKKSLDFVVQNKVPQQLQVQGLDVFNQDGGSRNKYWKVNNVPVLTDSGDLEYIIQSITDISEQVQSRQQLALTEDIEKSYHLFLSAPVIIGILRGDDYKIVLANDGLLEVWGRTSEVIGKPLIEAIPELAAQGFIGLLDHVRSTGEPFYAYEYPITLNRKGQDQVLYFDFVYKPIYENGVNEKANGIISVGHDVTPQVKARKKEQESQAKYRNLFESMDQGFCVLEMIFDSNDRALDYVFLEVNGTFERLTGLKDATGKSVRQLIPNIESHWLEIYGNVAKTGESNRFVEASEIMGQWFDVYAFPIDAENRNKVGLLFTDITEKKKAEQTIRESEERFRNLADDSPIFVFLVDPDPEAPVSYWNKTWLEYTGQSYVEAMGRAWNGLIHADDMQIVMQNYLPALEKREFYFLPAIRVKRHDGVYRWHAFKGNPRYNANGEFVGYIGVGFDIHEQKLNEEAIKQSEAALQVKVAERTAELERTVEELKRTNQNLEEFAYAASHDLKEPMRKIQIFSGRLQDHLRDKMTADDEHYFDRILFSTKRMNTLIEDLLLYSNVSKGAILKEEIDLNKKVKLVLEDLELEIDDKQAMIFVDDLPTINGHRRQLQQLFQNLIGNSIKYSVPERHPEVRITSRMVQGSDPKVPLIYLKDNRSYHLIEVNDNGVGFDQEDAERIFNVFTRLHGNDQYKGTGVGLSIARKVVENHGGYIWAESNRDKGATFRILLPVE